MIYIKHTGPAPIQGREGDAGHDVAIQGGPYVFEPGETRKLPTGLAIELPYGWCALAYPRSSSILRGIHVAGLIDSNYRGTLFMLTTNLNRDRIVIDAGARIAQLLILPVPQVRFVAVAKLSESNRGTLWDGSSGR